MNNGDWVTVNAEMAAQWLTLFQTDVQRSLSPGRVTELAAIMESDGWLPGSWINFGLLDGQYHLIDGQSRLHAIIRTGLPQVMEIRIWPVANRAELVARSEAINNTKPHSIWDKLKTRNNIAHLGFSDTDVKQLKKSFVFIDNRFTRGNSIPLPVPQIETMMERYCSGGHFYLDAVRSSKATMKSAMHWGVTIAVGLVTFQETAPTLGIFPQVWDFWEGVSQKINPRTGDPRGMAFDFLERTILRNSNGNMEDGKQPRTHAFVARYLARCFNAWVNGETIQAVRVDTEKPIMIVGSQFTGEV